MTINEFNSQNIYSKPKRVWIDRFSRKPHPLKFIFWILVVAGLIIFLGWLGEKQAIKNEINECKKWQTYAKQYKGFYMTLDQSMQCKQLNIPIGE